MSVFVGLDCGGSNCRLLAVDENSRVLFEGKGGPANLTSTGREQIAESLRAAKGACPKADFVCGCFAGLVNATTKSLGLELLGQAFPNAVLKAEPDFAAAFYSCPEIDLCVIAGTGSIVCGEHDGKLVKSGGRGHLLGDSGSGYQLGRLALIHYLDYPEEASEDLISGLVDAFGSADEAAVVSGVYSGVSPAQTVATFARHLVMAAKSEDVYSSKALLMQLQDLAEVVARHIDKSNMVQATIRLGLVGGVWDIDPLVKGLFEFCLKQRLPTIRFRISRPEVAPVWGAVALAMKTSTRP